MSEKTLITVETVVQAPIATVWECWTDPKHIMQWNNASDDWHTPHATNDVQEGGSFSIRMEAKDKSAGFDFAGTYTKVFNQKHIEYAMDDGRAVTVKFDQHNGQIRITETFEAESENPQTMQQQGWQAILDSFKTYVESL